MKSKYINTFNTTADYENYIESAYPEFPNVGYDKQAGEVNIRRTSPNDYQIWGTTTATSNFNIKLNGQNVEVTVDTLTGEFYLQGWTGTLTRVDSCFDGLSHITSIKKFAIDTSSLSTSNYLNSMFRNCISLTSINISGCDFSNPINNSNTFYYCNLLTDIYITEEGTLNKLTNNLQSSNYNALQSTPFIPSFTTIHYNGVDYKWQNNAWTLQS